MREAQKRLSQEIRVEQDYAERQRYVKKALLPVWLKLRLQMYCPDDPLVERDWTDNLLVNTNISKALFLREGFDLPDFVRSGIYPRPFERELLKISEIWLECESKFCIGVALQDAKNCRLLKPREIKNLLKLRPERISSKSEDAKFSPLCGADKILKLLGKLDMELARLCVRGRTGYPRHCEYFRIAEMIQEIARIRHHFDPCASFMPLDKRQGMAAGKVRDKIASMDLAMRRIERIAGPIFQAEERELARRKRSANSFCSDFDLALREERLSLWTKSDTCYGARVVATPFWSERYLGKDFFNDGEDWSEFYKFKKFCYLSHQAVIDSHLRLSELLYSDLITVEFSFLRQMVIKIDPATQNLAGPMPYAFDA